MPDVIIEIGSEFFSIQEISSGNNLTGLTAALTDVDIALHKNLSVFGAFQFDSTPWYDLLNVSRISRMENPSAYNIELEVADYFFTWHASSFIY